MKKFLPWLLVPLAAWLGHRESAVSPAPAASSAPAKTPAPVPEWIDASVSSIASADLETLLRRLAEPQEPPFTHEKAGEFRLICARLAELDPVAALEWIGKNLPEGGWFARMTVLTEWALINSEAAWAHLPAGPEGDRDRATITGRLLHEDRELFMEWFRRVKQPMPDGDPAWLLVAERYADELQEIADARIKELENPKEGMRFDFVPLIQLLAKSRALKDPAGALEWAMALAPSVRGTARIGILEVWAEKDPRAAWSELSHSPPDGDFPRFHRARIGTRILTNIARDDPAAAMQLILDPENKAGIFDSGAIDAMKTTLGPAVARGEIDPVDAYRLLNTAKGRDSNLPLNVFMKMWFGMPAERLSAAANGILAEPDDHLRGTALSGIAAAWMQNDPAAALAFIGGIADDEVRRSTYSGAFMMANGGVLDPRRQPERVAQIPAADRAYVVAHLFSRYDETPTPGQSPYTSGTDETRPELVVHLLDDVPPSPDLTRAAGFAAMKWGEADPTAALAWAEGIADPAARAAAHAGAIDGWAYHDTLSAAAWLAEKPAGPERDAATVPLVRRLATSDPASAWQWSAAVGDAGLQSEARISALKAWSSQAPDEARAAYQNHLATLPPAEAADFAKRYTAE